MLWIRIANEEEETKAPACYFVFSPYGYRCDRYPSRSGEAFVNYFDYMASKLMPPPPAVDPLSSALAFSLACNQNAKTEALVREALRDLQGDPSLGSRIL